MRSVHQRDRFVLGEVVRITAVIAGGLPGETVPDGDFGGSGRRGRNLFRLLETSTETLATGPRLRSAVHQ